MSNPANPLADFDMPILGVRVIPRRGPAPAPEFPCLDRLYRQPAFWRGAILARMALTAREPDVDRRAAHACAAAEYEIIARRVGAGEPPSAIPEFRAWLDRSATLAPHGAGPY
jgi:hypothetical protein